MRLSQAAGYFDRTVCADAFTPFTTFLGQLNLFDDSARDGTTVVRRVLSIKPSVSLPARRTVTIHGETWMIGGSHKDSFDGEVIRDKYVIHRADGLASVKTADQALRALAGTDMYAARLWVKDLKEVEISSKASSFFNLYVPQVETVPTGRFVLLSNRWNIVRNNFVGAAGFRICEVDELPEDCLGTAAYSATAGAVYNPTLDRVAPAAPATVPVLLHRWQDDFVYHRMSADTFEPGDMVAHVSKASITTAEPGDKFTFLNVVYRVLSVRDDGANAWTLHVRRD